MRDATSKTAYKHLERITEAFKSEAIQGVLEADAGFCWGALEVSHQLKGKAYDGKQRRGQAAIADAPLFC